MAGRKKQTVFTNKWRNNIVTLLFLGWSAQAQQRSITMSEAVEMAIANNPSVRAANLQIQQGQALQNLKYNLGSTDFSYQGDGLLKKMVSV